MNLSFRRLAALSAFTLVGGALLLPLLPSPASPAALQAAEAQILSVVQSPLTHRMVAAGPYQLHTVMVGEGDKPPLVMLHGHGGGVAVFSPVFDALAEEYTIYAIDLLGWGRSERPPFTGQSAEDAERWWVESLEAWRQEMGLEQMTLLGHSMGGWVAASYVQDHPERVAHLILVDAGGMDQEVHPFNGVYYNLPPQRLVRLAGPLGPALVRAARGGASADGPYPPGALLEYYYQLSAAPGSGEVAFRKVLGLREWALPLLPELAGVETATTLIWGAEDTLTTPDKAEIAHERMPRSELVLIPGAGHAPYDDTPSAFVDAILSSAFQVEVGQ